LFAILNKKANVPIMLKLPILNKDEIIYCDTLYHMRLLFKNAHINQCHNLAKIFKCERVYSSQNDHRSRDLSLLYQRHQLSVATDISRL